MLDAHVRTGHSWMASSLAGSAQMEPALTMCPRYSTDYCKKGTLLQFSTKMLVTKILLEDYTEMGKMVTKQLTEHQDII